MSKLTKKQPIVLVFYRGRCCILCSNQLAALATDFEKFRKKGITLVAISSDAPKRGLNLLKRLQLPYYLLTDAQSKIISLYGVHVKKRELIDMPALMGNRKDYAGKEVINMQNKGLLIGGVAVVVLLVVGGFFLLTRGGGDYQTPTTQTVPVQSTSSGEEKAVSSEAREITVSGSEFSFSPASINVRAGEKIKLTFNNSGKVSHNFTVQELGVATRTIGAGQSDTIEFTAKESGTLSFYCSVGNHRSLGMEGELVVE